MSVAAYTPDLFGGAHRVRPEAKTRAQDMQYARAEMRDTGSLSLLDLEALLMTRLTCDFNDSGFAFTSVDDSPLPPCRDEAVMVLVERDAVVRASCGEHADLARDEHPEATEYAITVARAA